MAVGYNQDLGMFVLTTNSTAYCMGVDGDGRLQQLYWGARLPYADDYPSCRQPGATIGVALALESLAGQERRFYPYEADAALLDEEYPGWGGLSYVEPALKLRFADGVRDLLLRYDSHQLVSAGELVITLRDEHYPLFVHLCYRALEDVDLIVRWAEIEQRGAQPIWLESAQSAAWHAPAGRAYRLSYLAGRWGNELQLQRSPLRQGKLQLESRRGVTSHHHAPWFALDPAGLSSEHAGQVWFGTLAWSGNWKIVAEYTANGQMRVTGGIHDFDFSWQLDPEARFVTPEFIGGYSELGFGGASRQLQRYGLRYAYPQAQRGRPWPVFFNTWETFGFNFDEPTLLALAERAAELGIEVFHVDDGWFGTRVSDSSGLGDWYPNRERFPNGLAPLASRLRELGLRLSLWVEPENVNLDSELYRAHPEWVYSFPTRSPTLQRQSLVLNLGREDVREHLWGCLERLVREYGVSHFKWDMNRHISEPGWPGLPAEQQQSLWVRHVQGVYELKRRLKAEFPELTLECCSGGGGRLDYGIMRWCELALPSDNHDPLARLLINEGYTQIFPAKTMGSWVTDTPSPLTGRRAPLKFIFHMAMLGALGIQSNLLAWDEQERDYARQMIALYKELRPIIQEGELYRLSSLRESHLAAVQYVDQAAERAVIFAFMRTSTALDAPAPNVLRWGQPRFHYTLYPQGLLSQRRYRVDGGPPRSGASLMRAGIELDLAGDDDSTLLRIEACS